MVMPATLKSQSLLGKKLRRNVKAAPTIVPNKKVAASADILSYQARIDMGAITISIKIAVQVNIHFVVPRVILALAWMLASIKEGILEIASWI